MEQPTFEQRLAKVKEIIDGIELGQQPLEESVRSFEKGIQVLNSLENELNEMKRRISILIEKPDGSTEEKPMEDSP